MLHNRNLKHLPSLGSDSKIQTTKEPLQNSIPIRITQSSIPNQGLAQLATLYDGIIDKFSHPSNMLFVTTKKINSRTA